MYEFDTSAEQYTTRTFIYAKDSSDFITGNDNNATNVFVMGDMTHFAGDRYVMIERDDFQGPPTVAQPAATEEAVSVRSQRGRSRDRRAEEAPARRPARHRRSRGHWRAARRHSRRTSFNFPLQSVESVTPVDDFTLLVGLDNNYPGGNGRVPGTPDGTEIITLRSRVPLRTLRVQPCKDASIGTRNGFY